MKTARILWQDHTQDTYRIKDTGKPNRLNHHETLMEAEPVDGSGQPFAFCWSDVSEIEYIKTD